jgi:L-fucose mutarotase
MATAKGLTNMSVVLKNMPHLLTPELLLGLARMGHGDDVAVVDANFPAHRLARQAGVPLVQLPGVSSTEVLAAVLHVLPLDNFDAHCAWTMQVVGEPDRTPEAVVQFKAMVAEHCRLAVLPLERFAFYEHTRSVSLVVQSGDLRKYANIVLRKGVIASD